MTDSAPHLIVVGGASQDILHFRGRTERSAGGAGLYTALAAQRAGASVTMLGPRPDPLPENLAEADRRIDWRGREVAPGELPSFEIAHLGDGKTEMRNVWWRAEASLTVDQVPEELPPGLVYCIALADPSRQADFLRHFKAKGRRLATGTFKRAFRDDPDSVGAALELADIFFCNEHEAAAIFGSLERASCLAGKLLFITRGPRGVRVVQGGHATDLDAIEVEELDPTGAGDTFCGTVLTWLERGAHPIEAAHFGRVAAAEMVTGVGPERLLSPAAAPTPSTRIALDADRIAAVAGLMADLPQVEPFGFDGPGHPRAGHPATLDCFFASTLQQFAFWSDDGERYSGPIVAEIGGERLKGSDFLARCYLRWLEDDPEGLTAPAQARLGRVELERRLSDDSGACPLPDLDGRLDLARSYGRDMGALGAGPAEAIRRANETDRPLAALLRFLDHVGGYKEDPLRKKSALLGIVLQQRPERFLATIEGDDAPPIVDYHVQRSCLRLGLVTIEDVDLRRRLEDRRLLDGHSEAAIRRACYRAVAELQRASGRSMGAVDWFLFQNRSRCPEMTEPDCERCPVDAACAHARELFQPVRRTTFY